jgi:hypothetical protein
MDVGAALTDGGGETGLVGPWRALRETGRGGGIVGESGREGRERKREKNEKGEREKEMGRRP